MDNQNPLIPLASGQEFSFSCHPEVDCFNACCRDLNQFLSPYDILCLKNGLGISSGEFLDQHASLHTGPGTGLPVAGLIPGPELACRFVGPEGCGVYGYRPGSCRIYPLARAAGMGEDGRPVERYYVLREPHCLGFSGGKQWTREAWLENQGLLPYNRFNDLFMSLIALKTKQEPGPLDKRRKELFVLACYDLDTFGVRLAAGDLPGLEGIPQSAFDKAGQGGTSLLEFSVNWAARTLFGEDRWNR